MKSKPSTYSAPRKEADLIRASRGFASFKAWGLSNRRAAREHRRKGRAALADALDWEFDRYIRAHK